MYGYGVEKVQLANAHATAWRWQQGTDAFELGANDVHARSEFSGLLQTSNYLCEHTKRTLM